ncbi:hypothetical protein 268TH004_48 [Bacillus phage 268TH004]|uniref:Uncharacterized protein n=1 Tax=Bacillus phage 268TH004 TaxID=2801523 RepID=A0A7T7ZAP0_9CAUD|nr:hypothetical protein 268TH004_48 [Bacillus phage 268TH004]
MYIPLNVVEAGKTDEYIKLTNRREHFVRQRKMIANEVVEASKKLYGFKPFKTTYGYNTEAGRQIQDDVLRAIKEAATENLLANDKLRRVDGIIKVIDSEIDELTKEDN